MPILNSRFGTSSSPPGAPTPAQQLQLKGPVVRVRLRPPGTETAPPPDPDPEVPQEVSGLALIDTGAAVTTVDRVAAERAGLLAIDTARLASATHANERVPVFAGRLEIVDLPAVGVINLPRGPGANLKPQGLIALIGRDLLSQCVLAYNGPDGSFSLAV